MIQNNIQVIQSVMDETATFNCHKKELKKAVVQQIINALGSYKKPCKKGSLIIPHPNLLGAYLCVSNVRNACKLCLIGVNDYTETLQIIQLNNEIAISLLYAIKNTSIKCIR
ncbi:hypothetical protein J2Q21_12330 [Tenacibaculum finnmarkense genomovar ulcerans]|uniref:hypothetical protein n=1 Tax=Tenacibaculum finnmarkense TaxID=2781243 RepID=UPI001EFA8949|nr:hypothetical protein [Tenacibaculum finnmarkense]MCG8237367.1 hypothetical protein [Tenacibaculum finnmarkense genomovar ulcerans]